MHHHRNQAAAPKIVIPDSYSFSLKQENLDKTQPVAFTMDEYYDAK
jgi:hypothetical protein